MKVDRSPADSAMSCWWGLMKSRHLVLDGWRAIVEFTELTKTLILFRRYRKLMFLPIAWRHLQIKNITQILQSIRCALIYVTQKQLKIRRELVAIGFHHLKNTFYSTFFWYNKFANLQSYYTKRLSLLWKMHSKTLRATSKTLRNKSIDIQKKLIFVWKLLNVDILAMLMYAWGIARFSRRRIEVG